MLCVLKDLCMREGNVLCCGRFVDHILSYFTHDERCLSVVDRRNCSQCAVFCCVTQTSYFCHWDTELSAASFYHSKIFKGLSNNVVVNRGFCGH